MSGSWTKDDVIELLVGILAGGRGGGGLPPPPGLATQMITGSGGSRPSSPPRQGRGGARRGRGSMRLPSTKKRRKVSKYQTEFGKQLKKLKKKHPRTPIGKLMKKAHSATKRAMK